MKAWSAPGRPFNVGPLFRKRLVHVLNYESSTTKPPRMSPVAFWLLVSILAGVTIALVSLIIDAGLAEYGREFIVVNLLLWVTPCVLGILAMCIARFRGRKR